MKGGHARSGPPPDPQALRRDRDASEWQRLPAIRTGPAPDWPLYRPTKREFAIWEREWKRPQAVMWESFGQVLEVAMYVRSLVAAEKSGASVASRTLLLRQQDALGLTTAGLRLNRWIIAADEPPDTVKPETRVAPAGGRAKARLEVLDGGA